MGKWLLALLMTVLIVNVALPHLAARARRSRIFRHLRLGQLPGDFSFSLFGRPIFLPLASTLLLSLLFTLVFRYL